MAHINNDYTSVLYSIFIGCCNETPHQKTTIYNRYAHRPMEKLLLIILIVGSLVLFIKWRVSKAQENLAGKTIPENLIKTPHHSDGVIYYFFHPKCGPCQQMLPIVDQLKEKYPDRVEKCNVAECRELTVAIGVTATPTTILVKNNNIVRAIIGSASEKNLETLLQPSRS